MPISLSVALAYPGNPDHPAGKWCVEYTDAAEVVHHAHMNTADLFSNLPPEVRRPLRDALSLVRDEINATSTQLTAERNAYRDTAASLAAEVVNLPVDP